MSVRDRPFVIVTWCDDIRQEVGNKASFMGVYTGNLVLPERPMVLAKLGANVQVHFPCDLVVSKCTLRVERSDNFELARVDLDLTREGIKREMSQAEEDFLEDPLGLPRVHSFNFGVLLGNVEVTAETDFFRVFVDLDDETIPSFRLNVKVAGGKVGTQAKA